MTDFHYPASVDELDAPVADAAPRFYVVSPSKLTILYLATLGIYGLYWFYKHWANYNRNCPDAAPAGNRIWPVARALFSVFFTHDLLGKIKHHGRRHPEVANWSERPLATQMVILAIVSSMLNRASYRSIGSPLTDILSLLVLLPLLYQMLQVQRMVNLGCGDPEGRSNDAFTTANIVWTVLGGLFWCLVIAGLFLPDA